VRRAYRGRIFTALGRLGASILAPTFAYHEDGVLVVGPDGAIAAVGPFDARAAVGPVTDLRPFLLVPGFVDAHVWAPHASVAGRGAGPRRAWRERVAYPEEERWLDEAHARAAAGELVARLVEHGTTTAALVGGASPRGMEALLDVVAGIGMRAVVACPLADRAGPAALRAPVADALASCRELAERWHGHDRGRLAVALAPRSARACSRALLDGVRELAAARDLAIHTELAEGEGDDAATRAAHPWAGTALDVLDAVGLLGERTVLAHAIHLDRPGWDRVAARGATVAHCPDASFFLGSGRMPTAWALERGIPVGLGTELGAGRSASVRRAMSSAHDSALCRGERVDPEALFALATLGGARALGLERGIGSLEIGKDADVAVFAAPAGARTPGELCAWLAFGTDELRAERVLVRGRKLSPVPPREAHRPPPKTPA
jgi:guanine deaminase